MGIGRRVVNGFFQNFCVLTLAVIAAHPQQQLIPRQAVAADSVDWLRDELEPIVLGSAPEPLQPRLVRDQAWTPPTVALVDAHLILAGLLGKVHRDVGFDHQLFGAELRPGVERGDSDRGGGAGLCPVVHRDRLFPDLAQDLLGDERSDASVSLGQDDRELIPAQACHAVGVANRRAQ